MRTRLVIVPALAAALLLGGCAANPYPAATAETLQNSVLSVTQASADGDLSGALSQLDVLAARADDAHTRGELTDERHADIAASIEGVRAQLQGMIAAAEQAAAEAQQQKIAEEAQRIADEQRAAEEAQRQQEEQQRKDQEKEDKKQEEEQKKQEEEQKKQEEEDEREERGGGKGDD